MLFVPLTTQLVWIYCLCTASSPLLCVVAFFPSPKKWSTDSICPLRLWFSFCRTFDYWSCWFFMKVFVSGFPLCSRVNRAWCFNPLNAQFCSAWSCLKYHWSSTRSVFEPCTIPLETSSLAMICCWESPSLPRITICLHRLSASCKVRFQSWERTDLITDV